MGIVKQAALVALICALAALTGLAIVAVPRLWHGPAADRNGLTAFAEQWPVRPIQAPEPEPNVVPFQSPLLIPVVTGPRRIATLSYRLVTEVPKTGLKVEREEPAPAPARAERLHDVCYPGRQVERRHGWRCVYARRR